MAELEYGNRDNIFNVAQTFGADGAHLEMAQNLAEVNDLVRDLPSYPANEGMAHSDARWDSIPSGEFISIGDAPASDFARASKYRETIGYLAKRYQCPEDVLGSQGTPDEIAAYRSDQERAIEEGLTQGLANALVRGTAGADPEKLDGILNRAPWNSAANTEYVFDVGGTSNLRHALLIKPGRTTFHLLHRKSHKTAGIERIDRGVVPVTVTSTDANGTANRTRFDVMTDFKWFVGWNIKNQKAVKIIANIDITYTNITQTLIRKILEARYIHTVISSMRGAVNPEMTVEAPWHLYVDPYVHIQLMDLAMNKSNVRYSPDNPYKFNLPMIGDIIIRRMEALNYAATQIT